MSWREAAAKSRTGPASLVKKTLNMLPPDCTTWGTPARVSSSPTAEESVAAAESMCA